MSAALLGAGPGAPFVLDAPTLAEALTSRAAEIMAKYGISQAMLDAEQDNTTVIDKVVWARKPYAEGMRNLLGITPKSNAEGCMQDVHWPAGLVGYFPAYTIGDMIEAQLFAAALRAKPEIPAELEQGNFKPEKIVNHTHEGSIGNLGNEHIVKSMEKILKSFDFGKVDKAVEGLTR